MAPLLDDHEVEDEPWLGSNAVQAPLPGPSIKRTSIAGDEASLSDYLVFAPKPSDLAGVSGAWSWDEEPSDEPSASAPEWNPISGFSRPSESGDAAILNHRPKLNPLILFQESSTAAAAAKSDRLEEPPSVSNSSGSRQIKEGVPEREGLPLATRDQVLSSCLGTSIGMTLLALIIRVGATSGYAPWIDRAAVEDLLTLTPTNPSLDAAIFAGSTGLVTSARFLLLQSWPEFREASDRSNQQILSSLGWLDISAIALLTGVSEELLFRGALIPATLPDWRGAVISGVVFGLLHLNGGRNLSFAAWASGVGVFYGLIFTITNDIWVPVAAHSAGNLAAAVIYKQKQSKRDICS